MKKLSFLLALVCLSTIVIAANVTREEAQNVAVKFYTLYTTADNSELQVLESWPTTYESVVVFYTFRFVKGGFVIVAADDASIPILGYSFDNDAVYQIDNPALKAWLDNYSREIKFLKANKSKNNVTRKEWKAILEGYYALPTTDVPPLTTTKWAQGCTYNTMCPVDSNATSYCYHVVTGCNPTAMSQIMKFHNFPPQGVGSASYVHPQYGLQTADFGNTMYNWASMPDSVVIQSPEVATIMYHAGVSIKLNYGASGSGSMFSEDIDAFVNYFNYDPALHMVHKNLYSDADWKSLLRADLDDSLPIFYCCTEHAFICDGYRMSDETFHINWGWRGNYNGYFAMGSLNPAGYDYNNNNSALLHLKPYNPDLIVRILNPASYQLHEAGQPIVIKAKLVRGSATGIRLFIDNNQVAATAADSLMYTWNTTAADKGSHDVRVYAYSTTDTVYNKIVLNISQWRPQSSGFSGAGITLWDVSAADSNVVWGIGQYEINAGLPSALFTRTNDGGNTWTPGLINDAAGLCVDKIFAYDALKAWVLAYNSSGTGIPGIFFTNNGGASWVRQTAFSATNWPNAVHFFNAFEGWCYGDPVGGVFEIFTTVDEGNTWTKVPGANIPNALASGEYGTNAYSAVGDTLWFATTGGRIFKSVDKGHTWTVSYINAFSGRYYIPSFKNGNHGIAGELSWNCMFPRTLCETFDGGNTWSPIYYFGPVYTSSLAYVPGTPNTWVSGGGDGYEEIGRTGFGCSYSLDGGHTWTDFPGTHGTAFFGMSWKNDHCGWAGGLTANAAQGGVYKFTGSIPEFASGIQAYSNPDRKISVYPNPAFDHFIIESDENMKELLIFDPLGKLIVQKRVTGKTFDFNISGIHQGIYELRVLTTVGYSCVKLIVWPQ